MSNIEQSLLLQDYVQSDPVIIAELDIIDISRIKSAISAQANSLSVAIHMGKSTHYETTVKEIQRLNDLYSKIAKAHNAVFTRSSDIAVNSN